MRTMAVSAIAAALLAVPVAAQEVVNVSGDEVAIYDLVGRVELVRGSGQNVVVRIERGGADAAQLSVETGVIGGRETVRIVFPGDEIVYPEMGRRSNSTLRVRDDGTFGDGGGSGGDRVRVSGSGSGLEAWADLVIEVPPGQTLAAYLGVGEMEATGIDGDLDLDTSSGNVVASDITGSLSIDTGSGGIDVAGVRGGIVSLDTGSGGVDVADVVADAVEIDTGSGGVDVRGVQADELSVDTGSGSVDIMAATAPDVEVDTGSGSIELQLLTDVDRLILDTGSGSVTVRAPANLGAMVEIDTGSGGIDLDFPLTVNSVRRDRVRGELGDGNGTIRIDTGSGSVRLLQGS